MNDTQATDPAKDRFVDSRVAAPDSVVQFLLAAAAEDFRLHNPPERISVRNMRYGYSISSEGHRQHLLCGEFLKKQEAHNAAWIPFVTIRTSGYEQWLGKQATAFCQDEAVVWEEVGDLSAALQRRLDAPR